MDYTIPASRCQAVIDTDPIRFIKAQRLLDDNAVELITDNGDERIYTVTSQSESQTQYTVRRSDYDAICTCPDSVKNHTQCKHIVAVLMIDPIKYDNADSGWAWENVRVTPNAKECLDWLYTFRDMMKPIPMSTIERQRFMSNRHLVDETDLSKPRFSNIEDRGSGGWYDGYKFDAVYLFGGHWNSTNDRNAKDQMTIHVYYDRKGEQWCLLNKHNGFCDTVEFKSPKGIISFYDGIPKNAMVDYFVKGMKLFITALDTYQELFGEHPYRMEFDNLIFHDSCVYFHVNDFAIEVSGDGNSVVIQHTLQTQEAICQLG